MRNRVELEPCICAVCRDCRRMAGASRCIYGGPYGGYEMMVEGKKLYVIMSNDYPAAVVSASTEEIAQNKADALKQDYVCRQHPNNPAEQKSLASRMYWRAMLEPFYELD